MNTPHSGRDIQQQPGQAAAAATANLDGGYPVNIDHAAADVTAAIKAVTIHVAEDWPDGRFCRNCHARHPCRLRRWGERVLQAAGWNDVNTIRPPERASHDNPPWTPHGETAP